MNSSNGVEAPIVPGKIIKSKKEVLSERQISAIRNPVPKASLPLHPVDLEQGTLIIFTKVWDEQAKEYRDDPLRQSYLEIAQIESEKREFLGLPTDSGILENDCPMLWDYLQAHETNYQNSTYTFDSAWIYQTRGLSEFIVYAYDMGLRSLRELDTHPHIWTTYFESIRDRVELDGTIYTPEYKSRLFLSFISTLTKGKVLRAGYTVRLPTSATEKLSRAMKSSSVALADRDSLYRKCISIAKHEVQSLLDDWKYYETVICTGKDERFSLSPKSETKFKNLLKGYYLNKPDVVIAAINKEFPLVEKSLLDETIDRYIESDGAAISQEILWLQKGYITRGFAEILGLRESNAGVHKRARLDVTQFGESFLSERSTGGDNLAEFARSLKNGVPPDGIKYTSTGKRERLPTFEYSRQRLYPYATDLAPVYAYINLVTGWNLSTIQNIPFDIDSCITINKEKTGTIRYELRSTKRRAKGKTQKYFGQVEERKLETSVNIINILRSYQRYIRFLNSLYPIADLDQKNGKLLMFFQQKGTKDRLFTYNYGDQQLPHNYFKFTDAIKYRGGKFAELSELKYGMVEGRHLRAEHLFHLYKGDLNRVAAELGHRGYLMTYLQNVVHLRQGQIEVAGFQSVLLDLLSKHEVVDPTVTSILWNCESENKGREMLGQLKDYRTRTGVRCSSGYVPPKATDNQTCRSGRCCLCENARLTKDSYIGLSKRLGEILWLQIHSPLGFEALVEHKIFFEQDQIISSLSREEYEEKIEEMAENWLRTMSDLNDKARSGMLEIDSLLR